jgi:hypothetical protein
VLRRPAGRIRAPAAWIHQGRRTPAGQAQRRPRPPALGPGEHPGVPARRLARQVLHADRRRQPHVHPAHLGDPAGPDGRRRLPRRGCGIPRNRDDPCRIPGPDLLRGGPRPLRGQAAARPARLRDRAHSPRPRTRRPRHAAGQVPAPPPGAGKLVHRRGHLDRANRAAASRPWPSATRTRETASARSPPSTSGPRSPPASTTSPPTRSRQPSPRNSDSLERAAEHHLAPDAPEPARPPLRQPQSRARHHRDLTRQGHRRWCPCIKSTTSGRERGLEIPWPQTSRAPIVNGQVAVPAGGQLKVPTPRVDQVLFRLVPPLALAWRIR